MTTSDLNRKVLGERLRDAREYLGMSQEEAARVLGIPRAAISLVESGKRRMDTIELAAVARLYQRPVSFFTGEGEVPALPKDIEHLARTATKLSERDREELARFVEYLSTRPPLGKRNGE